MMQPCPRVAIVGAGFGGLQAACSLANKNVEVVLIDRNNHHTFVPLLYQVATAQLAPEQVAVSLRTLLRRGKNLNFLQAEVTQIDLESKKIYTDRNVLHYDYLILATGSKSNFLGVSGAAQFTWQLKTLSQAVQLRNHLLQCFEQASLIADPSLREQLLTIAIVGGGATGVELAGSLLELIEHSLLKDFPHLNSQAVRLLLIQKSDRLLPEFSSALGKYTTKKLRKLGVKVLLESQVTAINKESLELDDGTQIATATTIWAVGGLGARPDFFAKNNATASGKIAVTPTLQLADYPQVFAIGDLARVPQQALSGVAPEALQQGVYVAHTICRRIQGKPIKPFNYFNKGRLAIIGCYSGIGQIAGIELTGFLPWLFWLAVHLVYFPDWRNRLMILLTWLHNYLWRDRAIKLILDNSLVPMSKQTVSLAVTQSINSE